LLGFVFPLDLFYYVKLMFKEDE